MREETGLDVRLTDLVGLYSRPNWGAGYHTAVVFRAQVIGGELQAQAGEVVDLRWFGPDQVPQDLLLGQRQRIVDALSGIGGSAVRSMLNARPPAWPPSRSALYAQRDQSGHDRLAYYQSLLTLAGPEQIQSEIS